jgi:hypothetical protein
MSTTRKKRKQKRETKPALAPTDPFLKDLAARLMRVRALVDALLEGQSLSGKELRKLLNALGIHKPSNTTGSHNTVGISLDPDHQVRRTIIRGHKNSSIHTNSNKVRSVFTKFGITSSKQIWVD